MNPFLLAAPERLKHWKDFRKNLTKRTEQEQLADVAKYFAQAPLLKIAYDLEDSSNWHPWKMINDGNWCRSSVAIGMEFTLRLAGWDANRLVLRHVIDDAISEMILLVEIDRAFALNYDWGSVVPYPKTDQRVLHEWQYSGKEYIDIR